MTPTESAALEASLKFHRIYLHSAYPTFKATRVAWSAAMEDLVRERAEQTRQDMLEPEGEDVVPLE